MRLRDNLRSHLSILLLICTFIRSLISLFSLLALEVASWFGLASCIVPVVMIHSPNLLLVRGRRNGTFAYLRMY
jgi:hypothetical protein